MAALIDLGFCGLSLAELERRRLAETQNVGCASKPSPENEPEANSDKQRLRDAEGDPIRPMSPQNAANQPKPRLASLPSVACVAARDEVRRIVHALRADARQNLARDRRFLRGGHRNQMIHLHVPVAAQRPAAITATPWAWVSRHKLAAVARRPEQVFMSSRQ